MQEEKKELRCPITGQALTRGNIVRVSAAELAGIIEAGVSASGLPRAENQVVTLAGYLNTGPVVGHPEFYGGRHRYRAGALCSREGARHLFRWYRQYANWWIAAGSRECLYLGALIAETTWKFRWQFHDFNVNCFFDAFPQPLVANAKLRHAMWRTRAILGTAGGYVPWVAVARALIAVGGRVGKAAIIAAAETVLDLPRYLYRRNNTEWVRTQPEAYRIAREVLIMRTLARRNGGTWTDTAAYDGGKNAHGVVYAIERSYSFVDDRLSMTRTIHAWEPDGTEHVFGPQISSPCFSDREIVAGCEALWELFWKWEAAEGRALLQTSMLPKQMILETQRSLGIRDSFGINLDEWPGDVVPGADLLPHYRPRAQHSWPARIIVNRLVHEMLKKRS